MNYEYEISRPFIIILTELNVKEQLQFMIRAYNIIVAIFSFQLKSANYQSKRNYIAYQSSDYLKVLIKQNLPLLLSSLKIYFTVMYLTLLAFSKSAKICAPLSVI